MKDQYFTPDYVAEQLVASFRRRKIRTVADFAAGDGELLRAAEAKWPNLSVFATDLDPKCASKLKRIHKNWNVGICDFLNEKSRNRSKFLPSLLGRIDLILLNPPFGSRGQAVPACLPSGAEINCSVAMGFILTSLAYLADSGTILAVIPASSLKSVRDQHAWNFVMQEFAVQPFLECNKKTFLGCAAKTQLIQLSKHKKVSTAQKTKRRRTIATVCVVRGAVPMHAARNGLAGPGFSIAHTTDLQETKVTETKHSIKQCRRFIVGPAVLIPRIGVPTPNKCVLYLRRKKLVLSDCVIGLKCESTETARLVQSTLKDNWSDFSRQYSSTCAPYITLKDLANSLSALGISVSSIDTSVYRKQRQ